MRLSLVQRETGARNLLVLLPGAGIKGNDFAEAGFLADIDERHLELDVVVVDVDIVTFCEGALSALKALDEEVLVPARRQGSRKIWLGGISLGGLVAVCHASQALETIDGLCLIAPYPGGRLTLKAVAESGGLHNWQPTAEQLEDPEFRAWCWLKAPPPNLPVFVGYGEQDRFAGSIRQLAECFPHASRCVLPGGHDWWTWRKLWSYFLDESHFVA